MGLLRNKKLLFCHITKTAGSTVHYIMETLDNLEFATRCYTFLQLKKLINNDDLFNSCLKICIVRNPWDRMVSTFFFKFKKNRIMGDVKQ